MPNDERDALRERWRALGWHGDLTLAQTLEAAARERPGTRFHFYTERGEQHSNAAALLERSRRVAIGLHAAGVRAGDRFAVQMPTSIETTLLYLAALRLGAVLVPIVHIYGPAELGFILRQSQARFLAVPARWRQIDFLARLSACGDLPALERVILAADANPAVSHLTWSELEEAGACGDPIACWSGPADDTALLLYTSGTSASPKGVRHSHNSVRAEWLTPFVDGDGPYYTPFPAGHIAGFNFLLRPFVTGTEMVFTDRWDAAQAAALIERHRVRLSGGTPFHLQALLEAAQRDSRDISSLAAYGLGGTGVAPEHVALAEARGIRASRSYGLTEHSTVSVGWAAMPFEQRAHCDGVVQPGTEVRVVDSNDRDLPAGEDGDILVRGPETFIGYTDPALEPEAFAPGGWFRTGDIGRLDAAGHLTITDRRKDIIIRGGENISSQEVERLLATHPAVQDLAVVAMPDACYGEKVCAVVVLRSHATLDLSAVQAHFAAAGVARQKTPEALLVVPDLPRTPTGKVRKAELRQRVRGINP
ncbi:AMP-binding protein [Piscinibacter sp. XHJ-5]|uniref:AMP-binding protein n=1 Tax=Piscinibacter sp. XHJ-5 TaxID=3037797 RepID=UPI002453734E|nr:AMP-binding protein [Piscinibacter sp. XHJ-5]